MTNDRIKELALASGFKLKEQPDGSLDLNPYVFDFANALLAEAALKWVPLTEELLNNLDSTDHQLKDTAGCISTGYYQIRRAGYPHGFVVNNRWVDARCIVEILDPQRI